MAEVQFFGQYLLEQELVSPASVADAVRYQQSVNLPLGALGLSKALLTERQVLTIHTEQKRTDQPFGEIAVQRGFLTREQLDELLKEQAEARVLLGEALVQQGHLTRNQLNEALITYHASQAQAEGRVRRELAELPSPELARSVTEVAGRMLLRMGRLTSKLHSVALGPPRALARSFAMRVSGARDFTLWVSLGDATLLEVARGMIRMIPDAEPPRAVDALVLDTGKEFLNITVGHVCSTLSRARGIETMPRPPRALAPGAELPTGEGEWQRLRLALPGGDAVELGLQLSA